MGFKIFRTNDASQPADTKFINMTDWLINNTLGKDRRRFDAMAYNVELNGNTVVFHPEADVLKNVSSADFAYYYAPDDSVTNMKNQQKIRSLKHLPLDETLQRYH